MTTDIVNEVTISGPLDDVFDLVTTTRYWTEWHPATVCVSGVVDRPIASGDVIRERAQIGQHEYEGNWIVTEHLRPTRVLLVGETGRVQIGYTFSVDGAATRFRRELQYEAEDFSASAPDPALLEQLMHRQSQVGLDKLKQLVEGLIARAPAP